MHPLCARFSGQAPGILSRSRPFIQVSGVRYRAPDSVSGLRFSALGVGEACGKVASPSPLIPPWTGAGYRAPRTENAHMGYAELATRYPEPGTWHLCTIPTSPVLTRHSLPVTRYSSLLLWVTRGIPPDVLDQIPTNFDNTKPHSFRSGRSAFPAGAPPRSLPFHITPFSEAVQGKGIGAGRGRS
jgi:hypothetical protein